MDADLLIKRLIARVIEWRVDALCLHQRGFDFEGSTLSACAAELETDIRSCGGE